MRKPKSNIVIHPAWKETRSAQECLEEVLSIARHSATRSVKKVVIVTVDDDGMVDYIAGPHTTIPWVEVHGLLALAQQLCFERNRQE
tara:strand:+ start:150 stop:410 length:261 start_codon:yes stop_codon:yes gene_type:complete